MKNFFWNVIAIFCTLFILTFEFEYSVLPQIFSLINPFFETLVSGVGETIFGLEKGFDPTISSDSLGLYIHFFNLVLISVVLRLALKVLLQGKNVNLRPYLLLLLTFYLSIQLLIYGFDKLFKAQFFFPEPNTLFTPLKDLSRDILYWSTMGTSRSYSVFLGGAEILVAVLLWFNKTRMLAAVLGTGIMLNVVMVNFSFDISVKVYSLFLLLCFLILLSPYFQFLFQVFTSNKEVKKPELVTVNFGRFESRKSVLKLGVILIFLIEGLHPFVSTKNFNDDTFPRPKFHGAYSVSENELGIKNVFVHRHGYLIFQNEKNEFQDYQMEVDSVNNQLLIFDYRTKKRFALKYQSLDNSFTQFDGKFENHELNFQLKNENLFQEEIYGKGFSWVVE